MITPQYLRLICFLCIAFAPLILAINTVHHFTPAQNYLTFISWGGSSNYSLHLVDVNRSVSHRLHQNPRLAGSHTWSLDGQHLAILSYWQSGSDDGALYAMTIGNPVIHSLNGMLSNPRSPVWSPDSSRIAFVADHDGGGEIFVARVDGSGLYNLSDHPADDSAPAWSPDGRRLVFVSQRDGNSEIYVADATGTTLLNLSLHPEADKAPLWSPNGEMVAFISRRDGNDDIYVVELDSRVVRNITNSPTKEYSFMWQ
jgi:Tol biopolymer transport system component